MLAAEHLILDKNKKSTPNLNDEKNYVVHIENLQYYIKKGLILKKIHCVVQFKKRRIINILLWIHAITKSQIP